MFRPFDCIALFEVLLLCIEYSFYSFNFSVDPFTRKDWYDVKAPAMFSVRNVGKTLVNRTQGTSKFNLFRYVVLIVNFFMVFKIFVNTFYLRSYF